MTRAIGPATGRALARLGWAIFSTYATRIQFDRLGGIGIARLTLSACGAWTVAYTDGTRPAEHSGQEANIFAAAMEANECAWAIRDGIPWQGSIAATYATRYPPPPA